MTSAEAGQAAVERMTALDAAFLYAETTRTPLHIGSMSVFEGAPFFDESGRFRLDAVKARVAERLHLFPRFRKRVAFVPFDIGRPFWVDDPAFDIDDHVKLMVLPPPGTRAELESLTARLHMRMLDRSRPLWELWFIGGLEDGRVGLVEKVHHAMVDGVSGVDVAAALLDLDRIPEPIDVPRWDPVAPPNSLHLVLEGIREDLAQPLEYVRSAAATLLSPRDAASRLVGVAGVVTAAARGLPALHPSPLRRGVGHTRLLRTISVPLEAVTDAGHRTGATVNDLTLTAVAGGVGRFLRDRGEPTDGGFLHVMVPVSVRREDEHLTLGNRVSAVLVALPLAESSPASRLVAVRDRMRAIKGHEQAQGTDVLLQGVEVVPAGLLALMSRAIHHQPVTDLVVTNIPGPARPLYFLGAELLESTPIVPLGGNLMIGIAVLSYNGRLTLGVHADGSACPDVGQLVDAIEHELDELTRSALADRRN